MGPRPLVTTFLAAALSSQAAMAEQIPERPIHDGKTFIKTAFNPTILPDGRVQLTIHSGASDYWSYKNAERIGLVNEGVDPSTIHTCPAFNYDDIQNQMEKGFGVFSFDITITATVTDEEKQAVEKEKCLIISKPPARSLPGLGL